MKIVKIIDETTLKRIDDLKLELGIKTGSGVVDKVIQDFPRIRDQRQLLESEVLALQEKLKAIDEELTRVLKESGADPG